MHILKIDGSTTELKDTSLEAMQEAVGGYIQELGMKDGRIMIVNEDGKRLELPRNEKATSMVDLFFSDDYIAGNAIILEEGECE